MNKKLIWGIVIAVVVIAGFLLKDSILAVMYGQAEYKSIKNQVELTEDWKTFTRYNKVSDNYFEIKYPSSWMADQDLGSQSMIYNPARQGKADTDQSSENILITGRSSSSVPCKESEWTIGFGSVNYKTTCVSDGEKNIEIKSVAFDEQSKIIEDQIISTFKFTSPTEVKSGDLGFAIQVISPKTGDAFKIGSKTTITWKDRNDAANYTISLVNRTTSKVESIIADNVFLRSSGLDGTTSYGWTVPALDTKASYNIEIYQATARELTGRSQPFTITDAAVSSQSSVKVLSPNGGETLKIGEKKLITWTAPQDLNRISITINKYYPECYQNGRYTCPPPTPTAPTTIANEISNTGQYEWTVGSQLIYGGTTDSGKYTISVVGSKPNTSAISDSSDNYFTITN